MAVRMDTQDQVVWQNAGVISLMSNECGSVVVHEHKNLFFETGFNSRSDRRADQNLTSAITRVSNIGTKFVCAGTSFKRFCMHISRQRRE